ncbi:MAG: CBS domain-containing protein [Acidimicrobiia bacterium]|nr:CBS domain-containing protein [Acidimicrobiia bacterium]
MRRTVAQLLEAKDPAVWSVRSDVTVYAALESMADKNVGALLVIDDGVLVGILSERDYARKVILMDRGSRETAVSEIMSRDPVTVAPSATTGECMQLMTDNRFRHLPVVDGQVVGIISIGDVVRAVIDEQQFMIDQLEGYITG